MALRSEINLTPKSISYFDQNDILIRCFYVLQLTESVQFVEHYEMLGHPVHRRISGRYRILHIKHQARVKYSQQVFAIAILCCFWICHSATI
jgi:hypothetical protein